MANLQHRDVVLHYQVAGDGEAVVLIHGLGANLAFWFMTIGRHLAQRYHVITYDLRGHGASSITPRGYALPNMVEDLNVLLDHLGVQRAHVVGHSFGARVALTFAINSPQRLQTLTIADTQLRCLQPPMRLREWQHWPRWKAELEAQGHTGLPDDQEIITFELLANFNELAPNFAHGGLAAGAASVPARKRAAPSLRRRDMGKRGTRRWQRLLQTTAAREEFSDETPLTSEAIAEIRAPTLAVFGELSHCMPSCQRLQQLIPGCEVEIVPAAGHFHPAVKPRRFTHILETFLARNGRDPRDRMLPHGHGRIRASLGRR
jgi:pimeloyl-ACP methyl ester carboxylesterase